MVYRFTRISIVLLCIGCNAVSFAQTSQVSFLTARNKQIVRENGQPFILRGMGLGGWMLQEGYMFKLSEFGQQHRIKKEISKLAGEEKTKWFYEQWLANHTTKTDIDSMAAWGFNSIRLPMHYNLYTKSIEEEPVKGKDTWIEKGFAITDSLLAWCKSNHLYLILDLHAAPGGQGHDLNISDRDTTKVSLWDSEENQRKTVALWRKLAERYANESWIGAYDIINEPNWGFEDPTDKQGARETKNAPLRKLMMDITAAIRAVDKKHIIIIEGNRWGNSYPGIMPLWDENMAISFHKYGNFNDQESIQTFLDLREQTNAPVWLGESGENSNPWFRDAIALVEKNGIGWAWWQEKKMGINNPLEIPVSKGYQKMLDYWFNKGPKPSVSESGKILDEMIASLKIGNNVYHRDVIDAMFRQVKEKLDTAATAVAISVPFKQQVLKNKLTINAVDYDLGAGGVAYNDTDTASYHYASTPSYGAGNRGHQYRNDGVDIEMDSSMQNMGFVVTKIEDGEWLRYTVQVQRSGTYEVSLMTSFFKSGGKVSVKAGGVSVEADIKKSMVVAGKLKLHAGQEIITVAALKGGFKFRSILFTRTGD